ncbi:MAG: hypothetical protein ACI4SE_01755 [Lachnospiraceae bacterium]
MRKKLYSVLTAVAIMFCGVLTVNAEEELSTEQLLVASTTASETSYKEYSGTSYSATILGIYCYCSITGNSNVQAVTSLDGQTVTISSKSYVDESTITANGSGGNAAGSTTSVSYTASGYVYRTYQEHGAPMLSKTAQVSLRRR